jgi:hypothetical protein
MFWSQREQLKEELRLRLRVAADLATLGAYELSEGDDGSSEHLVREEPPQRVFLFAKVAPVCPHSAVVERECGGPRSARRRSWANSAGRLRGGAARAPEQPCMCPVERVPAS